jgi:hypothetical protein
LRSIAHTYIDADGYADVHSWRRHAWAVADSQPVS